MTLVTSLPLQVRGADIQGADGRPVRLCGVNWGGAQQDEGVPYGLDRLARGEIIARLKSWGMNTVRLPWATSSFFTSTGQLKTGPAKAARLTANTDLDGRSCYELYCQLAVDLTAAGLYCILDHHQHYGGWCCSNADNQGLWYNDNWPSSVFTSAWVTLAKRFAANPLIGFDLHNEWRPATIGGRAVSPTWGDGNARTDVRQVMQNTIGRIRAAGAGGLVFCEGLSYAGDHTGWRAHPVTGQGIVASVHDYPWYHQAEDWASYQAHNDTRWGYLARDGIAPVWVGEFGTNTDAPTQTLFTGWFPNFLRYAAERRLHWCWWELSATAVLGTEPSTNAVKVRPGQREAFSLMAGQDWRGTQTDVLAALAPLMN